MPTGSVRGFGDLRFSDPRGAYVYGPDGAVLGRTPVTIPSPVAPLVVNLYLKGRGRVSRKIAAGRVDDVVLQLTPRKPPRRPRPEPEPTGGYGPVDGLMDYPEGKRKP